jgi:hypothetical protein
MTVTSDIDSFETTGAVQAMMFVNVNFSSLLTTLNVCVSLTQEDAVMFNSKPVKVY